ncbi:MAG: pyridoxal-phosphate dependent enzyme [Ignavibacteria bacterium]|nr:pyridoxal-phosphate dependent enzyme [Ignavibacteria bacterium]
MVDFNSVLEAQARISNYIHRTPVMSSVSINEMFGCELYFKCENLQKVGAFKARGACNAVFSLTDKQAALGVCTHSSGNHAQALAYAAKIRGIPCTIVIPHTAPSIKINGVRGYGAEIEFCEPSLADREEALQRVVERTGSHVVLPFNDERVIAGQGTAALELMEQVQNLDVIIAPVGGGGLLSGTLLSIHGANSVILCYGAEPEAADDALRSIRAGSIQPSIQPQTIADGLLTSLGTLTFPIIQQYVTDIVTASEPNIIAAMRIIMERVKLVVEPSGAVPLAAIMQNNAHFLGKRVGVIISGGNVDVSRLPFAATE